MTSLEAPTPPTVVVARERARGSAVTSMVKLPLQRLKPTIHKYLKVLDIHLHRLYQHQCNMGKLTKTEQWTQLHKEQINATRTTQQIKATLQELQRTRTQVVDNQIGDFHDLLQDFRVKVTAELEAFLHFCQGKPKADNGTGESNNVSPSQDNGITQATTVGPVDVQAQTPPTRVLSPPDNSCAAASRDQLRQEMEELYAMVVSFVNTITVTTEAEETAENDSSEIVSPISKEEKRNNKTSRLKMAVFPVVGALLGGAVAGPVGLFTGIKIGTLAGTVGGGVAGLAGTTILKSQSKTSAKMSDLNHNENFTKDANTTVPDTSTTQHAVVTQQSSSAMQNDTTSMSQSALLSSLCQTSSTQPPVDNRPAQSCDDDDDDDDNGNMSMSLWDQILFWGKSPETE